MVGFGDTVYSIFMSSTRRQMFANVIRGRTVHQTAPDDNKDTTVIKAEMWLPDRETRCL